MIHQGLFRYLGITLTWLISGCGEPSGADGIVSKHIEALGGIEKLKAVQSIKLTGKYITSGQERSFTIYKSRPNLFRFEVLVDGKKLIRAYDGRKASAFYEPQSPEAREIQDLRTKSFVERNADFDGALIDYQAKGHTVEFAGKQVIDGTETYGLKVTDKGGMVEDWYLNSSNFTLLKRTTKLPHPYDPNEEDITQVFFYMDHRPVDGLLIPHYMEREDMQFVWEHEIENVEINPNLNSNLFDMVTKS
jgi:outer membrane lipoprotein-sorting protein